MSSEHPGNVPFSFLCSLFREISLITPQTIASRSHEQNNGLSYPVIEVFKRWTVQLHKLFDPLPPGTTAIVFKFLFPEQDTRRKYDMQEETLAHYLADCIGTDPENFRKIFHENPLGSLGDEVKLALQRTSPGSEECVSPLSILEVDALLDELASNSGFSHRTIRKTYPKHVRRERLPLLRALFRPISPMDASFLTHIILKDLRPVLYPLHVQHYSSALLDFNTVSVHMLTIEHAMRVWDPTYWMLNIYRVKATIDNAAANFELPPHQRDANVPCIGIPVQIPKSEKGRNCAHALEFLRGSKKAWAETKYDGERAQIHVKILPDHTSTITIFSKSKRDSTLDRYAIHEIIRDALGLSGSPSPSKGRVKKNIILDAEMVACDGPNIDEFWRIRSLVENSAYGVRRRPHTDPPHLPDSQSSATTDVSKNHRLALVFFDILLLDERCLLWSPYSQRRALLESIISLSPGESMIAARTPIMIGGDHSDKQGQEDLEKAFAAIVADHQEGLVIKAEESRYHDHKMPWVKFKKDYIPGYGDAVDLVVVGAIWDKVRARELRVPPSTFTTLYIGALSNSTRVGTNSNCKPHFQVYFTVSYGLTRSQLEEINFLIKNSDPTPYRKLPGMNSLPYNFTLLRGLQPPSWLLKTPLLAELFGAGFTKAAFSKDYELRFPRLTKIYRPVERSWKEAATLEELQKIARDSMGLGKSDKDISDWSNDLWRGDISPGIDLTLKRKVSSDSQEANLSLGRDSKRLKSCPDSPTQRNRESDTKIRVHLSPLIVNVSIKGDTSHMIDSLLERTESDIHILSPQQLILPTPNLHPYPPRQSPPKLQSTNQRCISSSDVHSQRGSSGSLGMLFLENALIWISKSRSSGGTRHPTHQLRGHTFPRRQRIHSVESLLTGCGWSQDTVGSGWVERGVIFLDESTIHDKKWREYVLEVVEQRRWNQPAGLDKQRRKPIWVMDIRTWSPSVEDPHKIALHVLE